MRKFYFVTFLTIFIIHPVFAVTLTDALNQAFINNTELNAERENIKVSEEDLKISEGNYKPSVTITGSKSRENTRKLTNQSGGDASVKDVDPLTTSLKIEQTLLDIGRDVEYQKNKIFSLFSIIY